MEKVKELTKNDIYIDLSDNDRGYIYNGKKWIKTNCFGLFNVLNKQYE